MTVSTEQEGNILRYYHVEKWRRGTIARHLGLHRDTIDRVLQQAGFLKVKNLHRPSMIEAFLPFIQETLEKYPTLTASRLYDMVRERGYPGSPNHFRHMIGIYRPKRHAEAYHRLKTLPGEQAQVDWGHFGHMQIGRAKRPLMAFVMVLSYSRKTFLRFYMNQRMSHFLLGHEAAFEAFNGVPRVLLYDNLKSAVLERRGDAIRFHPTLLEFAAHYRYQPRPVAVARGNEKGRVERTIRYIRDNFFAARTWSDLDDLNTQATVWTEGLSADRACPEDREKTVRQVFIEEQPRLIALPDNPYPCEEREEVRIGKTPYARFDGNDYSVPYQHTRCTLTVLAAPQQIRIFNGSECIAEHVRSFDKSAQIENPLHIQELTDRKKQARQHRGQDRLIAVLPESQEFFIQAAERGYYLAGIARDLLRLLDNYGASEMAIAVKEALAHRVPHPNSVRLILQQRREAQNKPPPIKIELSRDQRVRDLSVRPHDLNEYDQLQGNSHEEII
jgi:transposase